jgi:8-oxo-dGTP pyrophosphatase MutT (NUDIX family)
VSDPEDGGDPAVTFRREFGEELGIEVAPEQVRPLREYMNPDFGRMRYVFYVEWPTPAANFVLSEGDGCAWFPLDAALMLPDLMTLAREDLAYFRDTVLLQPASAIPVMDAADLRQELYLIADEMRGAATLGKTFAANVYERERAESVMRLAAKVAALAEQTTVAEIAAIFDDDGWLRGSPAVGVDNLVLNERGEALLLKRRDNEHWCMPGGIAEIGQTPSEAALKELWEEAGLRGEIVRLLGVFDGRLWGSRTRVHMIHLVYLVECADLTPAPGIEMLEARFFGPDALPEPMHSGHGRRAPFCIELAESGRTFADPSSSYGIDMPMHQRPGH